MLPLYQNVLNLLNSNENAPNLTVLMPAVVKACVVLLRELAPSLTALMLYVHACFAAAAGAMGHSAIRVPVPKNFQLQGLEVVA